MLLYFQLRENVRSGKSGCSSEEKTCYQNYSQSTVQSDCQVSFLVILLITFLRIVLITLQLIVLIYISQL